MVVPIGFSPLMSETVSDVFGDKFGTKSFDRVMFEIIQKGYETSEESDAKFKVVLRELRSFFTSYWSQFFASIETSKLHINYADLQRVITHEEVWREQVITRGTLDRHYYIRPNKDESPELDAAYGVHMVDLRESSGIRVKGFKFFNLNDSPEQPFSKYIDAQPMRELAMYSLLWIRCPEKVCYLSDLIVLGFACNTRLFVFDPACRIVSEKLKLETRSKNTYVRVQPQLRPPSTAAKRKRGNSSSPGNSSSIDKKHKLLIGGTRKRRTRTIHRKSKRNSIQ